MTQESTPAPGKRPVNIGAAVAGGVIGLAAVAAAATLVVPPGGANRTATPTTPASTPAVATVEATPTISVAAPTATAIPVPPTTVRPVPPVPATTSPAKTSPAPRPSTATSTATRTATPTPTRTPSSAQPTATPPPAPAYPDVRLPGGGRECGRAGSGPYAAAGTGNASTSCGFAMNVRDAYVAAGIDGRSGALRAYSPTTRLTYDMTCNGSQPAICKGGRAGIVYVYGGQTA